MRKKTTPPTRAQARAAVNKMKQPTNLSRRQWAGVKALLKYIAGWYPHVYMGQERMARDLDVDVRSIRRYTRWAQEAGLLTVIPDQGVGVVSRTHVYHITELLELPDNLSATYRTNCPPIPTPTDVGVLHTDPPGRKTSSSTPSEGATFDRTNVRSVNRREGETDAEFLERVKAGAGDKRLAVRPPPTERGPARRMATHFANEWDEMAAENPEFRDIRQWESKAMTLGYLNNVFFYPESGRVYDEDEVRAFLSDFIEAVRTSRVQVKAGQSAFMRFTGWWSRSDWSTLQEDERPFMG